MVVNGIEFDSKKEAVRFLELQALEKAGKIGCLERQKKFVLVPAQYEPDTIGPRGGKKKGKLLEREVSYYADFFYMGENGFVVEDVKSEATRTPEYIIKRKLMRWLHGLEVLEV